MPERIGETIRRFRNERGWTQEELGRRAGGLNKETVNRVELGANTTTETLDALASAFEIDLEIRFTGGAEEGNVTSPVTKTDTLASAGGTLGSPPPEEGATAMQVPPHIMPLFMLIKDLSPDDVADVHAILYPVIKVCEGRRHGTTRVEAQAKPAAEAG